MSTSRRDSTLDEQKYPEEGMHRGFDKDDVKQQHHEHQFGAKAHHLIEKLKHKFEHTDYSQGTPAERLEHMSLDANKIVAAREKAAKEAQQAADAPFWEAEHKRLADLQNAPKSPKQKVNVSGTAPGPTAGRIMRGDVASSRGEFPSETQTDTKRAVPDRDDGVTQTISHTKQSQTLESGEGIVPRGLTLDEQKARGQPANQRVWQSGGDGDSSLAKSASPDSNATGGVSSHIRSGDSSSFSSFPGWRASKDSSSYWSKGSSQLDDKSTMAGSDSIPSVPSSSTSKDSNNLQAAQQRLVLPTYLPPDQRKQQSQGILSRTKESIEDTLDLAKDKIEHGLEVTRDNIEHGLEATKDTLEGGMAATREKVLEWKDDAEHALSSTKHTIVDKSNELTASIKEKASDMKEAITHKSHDLKENIDLKADQAKLKGREMVDDVKMKTRELKDDASSKAENLKDSIELKGDQVKLKGREWKSEVSSKSRDLKDDASLKTEQMKLKGREWQNDLAAKSRDLKDDAAIKSHNLKDSLELKGEQAKLKGRELSSDIKEGARDLKSNIENGASRLKDTALHAAEDVEDDAKSLYQRAKTSWWNPLSHLPSSGEVKEKASDVKDRAASKIDSATSPSSSVRISTGVTVNPVPLSLRGLEDSEELPKPQMPKKLRGLPTTQNLDAVHVPNSLRGLEDRSEVPPPAPGAHQQHGLVHRLFHMFDRDSGSLASHGGSLPSHSDIIAPSATRREKLDASVRDFWDFRAQDDIDARARAASAASTSAAPTSLRGLESDMRGLRSPVPSVPSVPSTSHRGIELPSASDLHVSPTHFGARSPQLGLARRQTWDILHDRQFEELLAETME